MRNVVRAANQEFTGNMPRPFYVCKTSRLNPYLKSLSGVLLCVLVLARPALPLPPSSSAAAATDNGPKEKLWLRESLQGSLSDFATKAKSPNASTSDLGYAALAELALKGDSVRAGVYLRHAIASQRADGTLPALEGASRIADANATEFGVESWGPILLRFSDRLDGRTNEALRTAARRALTGLRSRSVSIYYTNIALMQAVDVLLIGDALRDNEAVAWANERLDLWLRATRATGVREYDSPPYYRVDFDELALGITFSENASARRKLRTILAYLWQDVAAHVVGERFGGAHSRDYDFPNRTLAFHTHLALAGLAVPSLRPLPAIPMDVLTFLGADEISQIPVSARKIAGTVHVAEGRYGNDPTEIWYLSGNEQILLGSATGDYAPEDKTIDVTFNEWIGGIAVVPEGTGDPYGSQKSLDTTGIAKPTHLPLHPVCVQQHNVLLATLDLDPSSAGITPQLTTSILFPLNASVAVDGEHEDLSQQRRIPLTLNSVVTIKSARATAAVRVASLEGVHGTNASLALVSDAPGRAIQTGRIVATSYDGAARHLTEEHASVVILISVSDGNNDRIVTDLKSATVTSTGTKVRHIRAQVGSVDLSTDVDTTTRKPLRRSIDGRLLSIPPTLAVGGDQVMLRADESK